MSEMAAEPVVHEVRLRTVLAFHVACHACCGEARIEARDCAAIERFGATHVMPSLVQAEVFIDGVLRVLPVEITR